MLVCCSLTDRLNEVNRKVLSKCGRSPCGWGGGLAGRRMRIGFKHLVVTFTATDAVVSSVGFFPAHPPWVLGEGGCFFVWCPPLGLA